MCGILTYYNTQPISHEQIKGFISAVQTIAHRGPDDSGVTIINTLNAASESFVAEINSDKRVLDYSSVNNAELKKFHLMFGHTRLSIIDTSNAGHQPFQTLGYTIVFNGEIYNYIEIRNELIILGYKFKTQTDTEVIVMAFDAWREKCLSKFNGMFSFVIFNERENNLFIANDRFGVKPLYYCLIKGGVIFASEIKQFYKFKLELTVNEEVVRTFLSSQYIDYDDQTVFNEINRFPKANYAYLNLNESVSVFKFVSYYTLNTRVKHPIDYQEQFNYLFSDSIKLRMRSDVAIGFASSGGLDSSAILYRAYSLLKNEGKTINFKTFSAVFPGLDGDESEFIKIIEKDLQIKSHYVNPLELFSMDDFERHIYHQDMPVASTSYYAEWCLARLVNNNNVKVLLIGQGGDELLAGYHHHFYRYCRQLILQGKLKKYLSLLRSFCELKSLNVNKLHKQIVNEVKYSVKIKLGLKTAHHALETHWNSANKLIDLLKIDFSETMLPTYLRSDDRDSMAFGLETRHPFLDYRLVDFCFALPDDVKIKDGWQKHLLREALTELPDPIRYRKDKKGYTTPEKLWIEKNKNDFDQYLQYIPDKFRNEKSPNPFLNYALGAWFKVNKIN